MRIHLGHHFYGAGNLGDDFMLAGFLEAMRSLAPEASFSCCVPFDLGPLSQRFPEIEWLSYDDAARLRCIQRCDVWLGLGGSPFQSALSRWFIDHLVIDADYCSRERRPMFFLGVGVQTADELQVPDAQRICTQAAAIWTRDPASSERIRSLDSAPPVTAAADLAHVFFQQVPPPPAEPSRVTLVANFDYGAWPGQAAVMRALESVPAQELIWLAQESRPLPGAERQLFAALPQVEQSRWKLVAPDVPSAPLSKALSAWPSAEWLLTSRYHAALAGAWAGSKIVVLATNEKLRAVAHELRTPVLAPDANEAAVRQALEAALPALPPHANAKRARESCAAFLRSAVAHCR